MKRCFLLMLVVIMTVVMLTGCAPKEWTTFKEFFDEFADLPNKNGVLAILRGYEHKDDSSEDEVWLQYKDVTVNGEHWEALIIPESNEISITMIRKFMTAEDMNENYNILEKQLKKEFENRKGSDYYFWVDTNKNMSIRLTTTSNDDSFNIGLSYLCFMD